MAINRIERRSMYNFLLKDLDFGSMPVEMTIIPHTHWVDYFNYVTTDPITAALGRVRTKLAQIGEQENRDLVGQFNDELKLALPNHTLPVAAKAALRKMFLKK